MLKSLKSKKKEVTEAMGKGEGKRCEKDGGGLDSKREAVKQNTTKSQIPRGLDKRNVSFTVY